MYRDLMCGKISSTNEGKKVKLAGWVSRRRDHGQLIFIDLRDNYGVTQCVVDKSNQYFAKLEKIQLESVIRISGKVIERTKETINPELNTGEIEVSIDSFDILLFSIYESVIILQRNNYF